MKDESIAAVIDSVNEGTSDDYVFVRPISDFVKFGTVWPDFGVGKVGQERGYPFYFIYNPAGHCIAAVFDMGPSDLHVYVQPEYRRQGVMTTALREIILPHLLREDRSEQRVTFSSPEARRLLEKVGFEIVGDSVARITAERCKRVSFPEEAKLPFPQIRMKAIQKRLRLASGLLRMTSEECGLYLSQSIEEQTECWSEDLYDLSGRVEDAWRKLNDAAGKAAGSS